jgi:aspartyl-tRNA(Asn)/glutamyl-tRNA(Gln) amidotransferase subunit B
MSGNDRWEPVIGLEIHVQLNTDSKMFCRCENRFGDEPNTRTCPVCLGHPGALPTINAGAVEKAIQIGLALDCDIAGRCQFHRKNYFYPDSPKAYQISQYDQPICEHGHLGVDGDRIGITRAHLEEDAAKLVHAGGAGGRIAGAESSVVDFNRCGTPLVEIVTEPDIRSPEQALAFLGLLKNTLQTIGVSDCDMEKGSLRCDANVSVRPRGETSLGTKTELKNMNSFKFLGEGMAAEIERQIGLVEAGEPVLQETLHYDPAGRELHARRSKEEADDYRYFPEPDLVPLDPPTELVERVRTEVPELPGSRIRRFEREYELSYYDAEVLNGSAALAHLYEQVALDGVDAKAASNVLMNDFVATGIDPAAVDGTELGKLIAARGTIPRETFTRALADSGDPEFRAETYLGDSLVADTAELEPLVVRVLADNPGQVAEYKGGKEGLLGFFVGQVMKETQGKADPKVVNELLRAKLQD